MSYMGPGDKIDCMKWMWVFQTGCLDALLFKGQLLIHLVSSWALFLHIIGLINLCEVFVLK